MYLPGQRRECLERLAEGRHQEQHEEDSVEERMGDHARGQLAGSVAEVPEDQRHGKEHERSQWALVEHVGKAEEDRRDEDGRDRADPAGECSLEQPRKKSSSTIGAPTTVRRTTTTQPARLEGVTPTTAGWRHGERRNQSRRGRDR